MPFDRDSLAISAMLAVFLIGYFLQRRHDRNIIESLRIEKWYHVTFDEEWIYQNVSPPGGMPWQSILRWDEIIRICYKTEGLDASDGIYVFTSTRPQSYTIPTEADGGGELWNEILSRDLFDPALAIKAATCSEPDCLFCWPKEQEDPERPRDANER